VRNENFSHCSLSLPPTAHPPCGTSNARYRSSIADRRLPFVGRQPSDAKVECLMPTVERQHPNADLRSPDVGRRTPISGIRLLDAKCPSVACRQPPHLPAVSHYYLGRRNFISLLNEFIFQEQKFCKVIKCVFLLRNSFGQ